MPPQSLPLSFCTPQLSKIWISYSPLNFTPELEPLGTMNSIDSSRSPNDCLVSKLFVRPFGPLTMAPVPFSPASRRGFAGSSPTLPATNHSPVGGRQAAKPSFSERLIQPSSEF